ncbi:RDD family protein [Pustulibacterium marinum]|nr:RDD family protein [Pustulibacterium marinum]
MTSTQKPKIITRIGAMLLDHVAMTFVAIIFMIPFMIGVFSNALQVSHEPSSFAFSKVLLYIALLGFSLYFCKDSFQGRSLGKRVTKLQVHNYKTGQIAHPMRCFIRNIFIIIWPLEVIMTLINPSRRLGDYVAGTCVVTYDAATDQPKTNYAQVGMAIVISYVILLLISLPYIGSFNGPTSNSVHYVESSLNTPAAAETTQMFADSLGEVLTADVRVYDHIKEDENLSYVSVIVRLNENYLANDDDYESLKSAILPLLYSKFPQGTFVGRIKYVYQQGGTIKMRSMTLDWRDEEK